MNNVTLIGMPGSGKSTIGVILAKALRYEFLDSDLLIRTGEKKAFRDHRAGRTGKILRKLKIRLMQTFM